MHRAFEVTVLGTSSASPTKYRHPSGQFVRMEGEYFLIDCGEGTQHQMVRLGLRMHRIKYVLITHMHGDHFFGLPGLITSMGLFGRKEKLVIAGPHNLEFTLRTVLASGDAKLPFELEFIICREDKPEVIISDAFFEVETVPLRHRVPCTGYILREKGPELKLNIRECESLNIPVAEYENIKSGMDYVTPEGKVIPNAMLTFPGKKNRSYAYISDTVFDQKIASYISGVSMLYHESTFLHELESRATETFHTTARQAGHIAGLAGVQRLLIGHFSARYASADPLLAEAREVFPSAEAAVEGETYLI